MPDERTSAELIAEECDALKAMLLEKNRRYGEEQIRVRLDDKLSRLARGSGTETEDVELDLMGYLVLLRVARRRAPGSVVEVAHA